MEFADLNISKRTIETLKRMGYLNPTEVQEKTIPEILAGKEVIVRSQTGSGKTAAFGISLIESLLRHPDGKALILAPTRELALQIGKEIHRISEGTGLKIYAFYGGQDIGSQIRLISRGFDIIVATPGRLLDHFNRKTLDLSEFTHVVLDEADRMLDMGFREDIYTVLEHVSKDRLILLFSATINSDVRAISTSFMRNPITIEVGEEERAPTIEEETHELPRAEKFSKLLSLLKDPALTRAIIFVATKRSADWLNEKLARAHIRSNCLHGDLTQNRREHVMRQFREGVFQVLVATDVASRGLHVDDISHIINYDEAIDAATHTHRIGRTGRMGKSGKAITFKQTDFQPRQGGRPHLSRRNSSDRSYNFGGGQSRPSHGGYGSESRSAGGNYHSSHKNNTRSRKPSNRGHFRKSRPSSY